MRFLKFCCFVLFLALALLVRTSTPTWTLRALDCDYYVDNTAGSSGNGSWNHPWDNIEDHVDELGPGDTMCVRGDISGPGRVYQANQILLDSQEGRVRNGLPGNPITIRAYPSERVILRNVSSDYFIYFRGVDYWILDGFVIDNNGRGKYTIRFRYNANHNIVSNNEIYNGEVDGIALGSGDDYERNIGNVIECNHIHHFVKDGDAHCILLNPGSDNTLIQNNIIHDCSGDGVQIYAVDETPVDEYVKNVQIVDNTFYRGTLPRSEDGLDIKGVDGLMVIGNELYGYEWYGRAIVVHIGRSRDLLFDSNVIHDTSAGMDFHGARLDSITLTNNLFYNITKGQQEHYAISLSGIHGIHVYHNTIVSALGCSLCVGQEGLHSGAIKNNLIYNSDRAHVSSHAPFSDVDVGYNGWFDADRENEFVDPTDTVGSGDPGFVDASSNDYHLAAISPARDAGTNVEVSTDFEGDARTFGGRPDIGADEYVPPLHLTAIPQDRTIYLKWTEFADPALDSYAIEYTYESGGSDASQGPSPILGIPPPTRMYPLTQVTNYVFYTVTIVAHDANHVELAASNSVRVMPTDFLLYLPSSMKASSRKSGGAMFLRKISAFLIR